MYLDIKKYGRVVGRLVAIIILIFGVVSFSLSLTVQDQIAGTLVALFGLQLFWFITWLSRGK